MSILALLGPSASGKSQLAYELATSRGRADAPTEIVAVDAFTVYRGMDVGTAKPSAAERSQVVHHLVDVVDPHEEMTVARFQRMVREAIHSVLAAGSTPLLVGGSGLYWRAAVDDLEFPPTDAAVRRRLHRLWADTPERAHARLAELDPGAAGRIDPNNLRRTLRALEVIELTGRRFSAFRTAWDRHDSVFDGLEAARLDPEDRQLRAAIERRSRGMVARGLLAEAETLRRRWRLSRTARQAIGYREAFAVLDGQAPVDGLADAISARTWRYARRQRSWFRADPRCQAASPAQLRDRWSA